MKAKLIAILAMAVAALGASGDEVVRWYDSAQKLTWGYVVTNGEATISTPNFWDSNARDTCKGDIVVPARIGPDGPDGAKTYPVRDMAPGLFRNCTKVTSVTLPDGICRIAPNAFYFDSGSTITNVTVGAGCLDIGENAFCRCHSLVSVNIPGTVTNIAKNAFTMCRALPSVDIPGSVKTIGDSAFSACSALVEATFGDGIEALAADAFMGCTELTAASLPASVKSIGFRAFSGCRKLASVELSEGLEDIGDAAFYSCESLVSANIPASVVHVGNGAFQYCPDALFDFSKVDNVGMLDGWAVVSATGLSGAVDLSGANGVADGFFANKSNVTSVKLPSGMKSIGGQMFGGCSSLATVALPAGLESVGGYAFQNCTQIESVTLPSCVTNIGEYAFYGCSKLVAVALPAGLAEMGESAFCKCGAIGNITVPASLKRIPMCAFQYCTGLESVEVEEGVETIGNAAFDGCTGLQSFTIPDSVRTVEDIAFLSCSFVDRDSIANVEMVDGWIVRSDQEKLTEVTVPGGIRGISDDAFAYRRNLTNAVLEAGVKRIPDRCFNCAVSLSDVSMPGTLEDVGDFAFYNTALVEAWVPSNVVAIGEKAFGGCKSLEAVYLPVALKGKVDEADLVDPSFGAVVRYYKEDGTVEEVVVLEPGWIDLDFEGEYKADGDGSFELALNGFADPESSPKFTVKGLPSGLKYDAGSMTISGKATKPGVYAVTVSATNATVKQPVTATFQLVVPNLTCEALPELQPEADAYGAVQCGVAFPSWLVDCTTFEEGWTVKAAGLPSGLKWDAKSGVITGVPTKAGTNTVTFTASKKGEKNQVATITLVTAALPAWAQGTFTGYVRLYGGEPDYEDDLGLATMTVGANGKVSGKVSLCGTNWTFAAASYARSDGDDYFEVSAEAKAGKATMPVWIMVSGSAGAGELQNATAEGWLGGYLVAPVSMRRNMWKDKATASAAKEEIAGWMGLYTLSLEDGGYLSLNVGKDGTVKAAGKLADGTGVSASSPLMHDADNGWFAYVYAAPSAYKGGAFALSPGFEVVDGGWRVLASGLGISQWSSRNPQATGEYGAGFVRHPEFLGAYYDKAKKLNEFYAARRFDLESLPVLNISRKVTYLDEYGKKKTVSVADEAYAADTFAQPGLVAAVNEKGAFVVEKATKPVQDKETKEWSYAGANDGALTLSFAQATGIFKGSYTLWYDYVSAEDETTGKTTSAHVSKKVSFEGVMVQGWDKMRGFFLWDATGSYEDPKTGKEKAYKFKESRFALLLEP